MSYSDIHKARQGAKLSYSSRKKSGIHIKPSHEGRLHEDLGVKQGEKIPESKLRKAMHSGSAAERKRAVFAENAKHWKH